MVHLKQIYASSPAILDLLNPTLAGTKSKFTKILFILFSWWQRRELIVSRDAYGHKTMNFHGLATSQGMICMII